MPKLVPKPWIPAKAAPWILRDTLVVDPANSVILDGRYDIAIEGGLITSVCPTDEKKALTSTYAPEELESPPVVVNVSGRFICP